MSDALERIASAQTLWDAHAIAHAELKPRHFHDTPTIREMLDKMEEKRTCDAPCLVAMMRLAVNTLEWYADSRGPESRLDDNGDSATHTLQCIERNLWATSPRELWFEAPESESLAGRAAGAGGVGENLPTKDATENDKLTDAAGGI